MHLAVLDAATLGDVDLGSLSRGFKTWEFYDATGPERTAERLAGATVAVVNKVVLDRAALTAAENLKLICVAATGYDNIDLEAARERGAAVANAPGYSTESVVAQTFALYFQLAHHSRYYDEYVKSGAWSAGPIFTHLGRPFSQLAAKRWGVVGMGAIGRAVAKAAQAFGGSVVYCSTSGANLDQPYPRLSLERLLGDADVVSIHAPLNPRTRHLIRSAELALMKPSAILINVGRGGIVHEADLARCLDAGGIAGAGVDVLEQEPPPADHPLLRLRCPERLAIAPHIAWSSVEARQRLVSIIAENIRAYFAGAPVNLVASA